MNVNKQLLYEIWFVVTIVALLGFCIYTTYLEWTEDLTRKQMLKLFFIDWAPWSYLLIVNGVVMVFTTKRK